jgi:DivIVA domain-containing protein
MRRKGKDTTEGDSFASPEPSSGTKTISPLDIQQKEFGVSKFGGYRMRDVDEFLDQVTDAMSAALGQSEQMRKNAGLSQVVGTPDLADVNRQADEIIQRARDEAARIVAEAREQAASLSASGAVGATAGAERAAINAFLAREKEFLQSLAGLVQGHAEGVKSMARSARSKPSTPGSSTKTPATEAQPAPTSAAATRPDKDEAQATPAPTPPPARSDVTAAMPRTQAPAKAPAEEPVRLVEPEPAAVRRADPGDAGSGSDDDGSLRDLFWGED